jgi:hypothetical protein
MGSLVKSSLFGFLSGKCSSLGTPGGRPVEEDPNEGRPDPRSSPIKDPDEWTTGAEPMTGAQESYLNTLASEAGEQIESQLTKAEASKRIDELQGKTGRGQGSRRRPA